MTSTAEENAIQEHQYIQEVILSQERIDAFLKEEDAYIRYNKFMRSFGDAHLNNIYKLIVELINHNDLKNEVLEQIIRRLKEIIEEDVHLVFGSHEEIKHLIEKMETEKAFFKKQVSSRLEQERHALAVHLDRQIEAFFHVQLFNALYRKIVPYPKSKVIYFKSDFSAKRPQLNVFITGENEGEPIVPSQHFSPAQLNILSLSIFLAKALNVKDNEGNPVDCIFIDDPIQTLDSINILSTIDLLRSIVVNLGKQIIMSTHDENFHHLLQKKIPPEKFKAKYIELETIGMVKQ